MVFPVVMYGCESWTVKKAECWRIDAFELWCWRRLLRVPWTARRSSQSILKETSPGRSLEGLMLRLKLQYFGHLMQRVGWLIGKDPDAGRGWGQEVKGTAEDEMDRWHYRFNAQEFGWTLGVGDGEGDLACCDSWGRKESDMTERLNWLTDWLTDWNGLIAPTKRQRLAEWIQNKTPIYAVYKRPTSNLGTHTDWKWRAGKRNFMQMQMKRKQA